MARGSNSRDGRAARSEGASTPRRDPRMVTVGFDMLATTTGFKWTQKQDLGEVSAKMTKALAPLDESQRKTLFESFESKGQTGYFLDKETVDYAKKEAGRLWDEVVSKDFDYLKAEFPDEFKGFTKDWAFGRPGSETATVEAKAKQIFVDEVVRRTSAIIRGAQGGDEGKSATKGWNNSYEAKVGLEYSANLNTNKSFSKVMTRGLNESVQIARDAITSRLIKILAP